VKGGVIALTPAALAALISGVGCHGGGSPEEALEAYNGAMAAKDFAGAAHTVYCESWGGYDAGELAKAREAYGRELEGSYELSNLDYGRAEIVRRDRVANDLVRLLVNYKRRSAGAPAAAYEMHFKLINGSWYYYVPTTLAPTK